MNDKKILKWIKLELNLLLQEKEVDFLIDKIRILNEQLAVLENERIKQTKIFPTIEYDK